MRKQMIRTALAAAALGFFMLAGGCGNPLSPPDAESGIRKPAAPAAESPGTGRVRVRLAGSGARTLMPAEQAYDSFVIAFAGPAGTPAAAELTKSRAEMDAGIAVDLAEGVWNITVTGYVSIRGVAGIEDGLYPAASGSKAAAVEAGGDAEAAVDLYYSAEAGDGVFTYAAALPAHARRASLRLLTVEGEELSPAVSFDLLNASGGSVKLASGYYLAQAEAEGYGDDRAVKTEIVHIYRALTTALTLTEEFRFLRNTVIEPSAAGAYTLTEKLAAPAADAPVQAGVAETAWYSAELEWSPGEELGYYGFGIAYTASVRLTPKAGLTFGAPAGDAFRHTGALGVTRTLNDDGTVTAAVSFAATEGLDHTGAHDGTRTGAGLYIGARGTPKSGVNSLDDALAWIAANAAEGGRYRYVLGGDISLGARNLDAAAFGNRSGAVITLAGDGTARTAQLTGAGQLFKVSGGTLRLEADIILKGVNANTGNALIGVDTGGTLIMEAGSKITGNNGTGGGNWAGGGVRMRGGAFIMEGGEISGNTHVNGNAGGVVLNGGGAPQFTMRGGTIRGNEGRYGGGVNVGSGTFTMSGGLITENTAQGGTDANGGGVWMGNVAFEMSGGIISGNQAQNGGGVYGNSGTFTVSGSGAVISGNEASADGGGVYIRGTFNLRDTAAIKGNTAGGRGGGVYIVQGGAAAKTGGTIYGAGAGEDANAAEGGGPAVYIATAAPFARKTTLTADAMLEKTAVRTASLPPQNDAGMITISSVAADGASGATSSKLTFTFGSAVSGLEAGNFWVSSTAVAVDGPASAAGNNAWEVPITTTMRGNISAGVDFPGVTMNPVSGIAVFCQNPTPAAVGSVALAGGDDTGISALADSGAVIIVFSRALDEGDDNSDPFTVSSIALSGGTPGEATLGTLTKDLETDPDGKTYRLALASVVKEGGITLTFNHYDIDSADADGAGPNPPANVKTLRVFKNADHTAAHGTAAAAGLYAGSMGVPVFGLGNTDDGANLLTKSFEWIAANARDNGKYRVVLGAGASQAARDLDAAAFSTKTGAVITLEGTGAERTVQLSAQGTLFTVSGGTLRLGNYITLNKCTGNNNAPLVVVAAGGTLVMETGSKIAGNTGSATTNGVTMNGGTFTMNGGEISGNVATEGGGVLLANDNTISKTFNMTGGTITGNRGNYGGGVAVRAGGTFNMSGTAKISSNQGNGGDEQGGGVYLNGTAFNMSGTAEISSNQGKVGGGVYCNGVFLMEGGAVIKGNTAVNYGGGVQAQGGRFDMKGGGIKGNQVTSTVANFGYGGGVNCAKGGFFQKTFSGGIINGSNEGTEADRNTTVRADSGAAVSIAYVDSGFQLVKKLENTVNADHDVKKNWDWHHEAQNLGQLNAANGWDE